jgi:S1-C subfamily serine protease
MMAMGLVHRDMGWFSDEIDYNPLRFSVVRIQAVSSDFDWIEPFFGSAGGVGLGTGWVVQTDPEPLFITNAHVVTNANDVKLQLLVHSNKKWAAEVVMISHKFDMALLMLKEKDEFLTALAEESMELRPLPISTSVPSMGLPVVAVGFPLGMDNLKISSGVVAGNEDVEGLNCIQSTAPISPGSSGGPLLLKDGSEVIGINFAKSASMDAENVNYVIPAWRIRGMVETYKIMNEKQDGIKSRLQVRIPDADAVIVEANEALHAMQNCSEGLFLSFLGAKSFFLQATPPVPQQSFLTKVRGIEIDQFGMGVDKNFCEDRVRYTDLIYMQDDFTGEVEVEVCHQGRLTTHQVPLSWKSSAYDQGILYVDEPTFEENLTQYVVFGDIAVMQLTFNHIELLYRSNPTLAGFLQPDLMEQSRLIMPFVSPGSYASEFLRPGSIVKRVNGHEVFTLDDFREHFVPDAVKNKNIGQNVDINELDMENDDGMDDALEEEVDHTSTLQTSTQGGHVSNALGGRPDHGKPAFLAKQDKRNESIDDPLISDYFDDLVSMLNDTEIIEASTDQTGEAVWTLETDDGEVYAVFFDESLQEQVAEADDAESSYLLPYVVLKAAMDRKALPTSPSPFLRGLLGTKPTHLQLNSAPVRRSVETLPASIRADIPLKQAGTSGWLERLRQIAK